MQDSKQDVLFDLYEKVFTHINQVYSEEDFNLNNIDEIIKISMETVEHYMINNSHFSGTAKSLLVKNLLIKILRHLKKNKKIDKDLASNLILSIQILGPIMFKLIVMADKGKFNLEHLNTIVTASSKCCLASKIKK